MRFVSLELTILLWIKLQKLFKNSSIKKLKFEISENMNHYVWSLDNKVVYKTEKILIKKVENFRIKICNYSMMRHSMHLYGDDFRLLNIKGDFLLLKNIVDIIPMETYVLQFNANLKGNWFFYCYVHYNMMSGMECILPRKIKLQILKL